MLDETITSRPLCSKRKAYTPKQNSKHLKNDNQAAMAGASICHVDGGSERIHSEKSHCSIQAGNAGQARHIKRESVDLDEPFLRQQFVAANMGIEHICGCSTQGLAGNHVGNEARHRLNPQRPVMDAPRG